MGTAYIQSIDITEDDKIVVTGQLSRTNLRVALIENIPIQPPSDGIWDYDLEVTPTSLNGSTMMEFFQVEAPWIGDENANGLRITQPSFDPATPDKETIQLKGKKVSEFTATQKTAVRLCGASYNLMQRQLIIDVLFSGGWFSHLFALEWDGIKLKSNPPQYNFNLVDLVAEYDPGRAVYNPQLRFDINSHDFHIETPSMINIRTPGYGRTLRVHID